MTFAKRTIRALMALALFLSGCVASIIDSLGPQLSPQAWITSDNDTAMRWTDYHAPSAKYYVHVAEETDIAITVCLHLNP